MNRSVTINRVGAQLLVWVLALGGCTKDPVEHFQPPRQRPDETTKPDKTSSNKGANDAGSTTPQDAGPRDSSVVTPGDSDASITFDGGHVGAVDGGSSDSGQTTVGAPVSERIEASIVAQCGARPVSTGEFSRQALREAAGDCAMWHYCSFQVVAQELDRAITSYDSDPSPSNLEQAQEVWRLAMIDWSRVELFQFGPMGSLSQSAGKDPYEGRGIRDLIYAWPSTSACRVDEQLITQNYVSRGVESTLISGRGLFALEYLLFSSGTDSACAASTSTAQEWADLGETKLAQRKRAYARAVSGDVLTQMRTLGDLWSPEEGNFKTTLVDAAGKYPNEQEAMQAIAWSLIYAERELKDWKLGIPAGHTLTHPVSNPETPYAQLGIEAIRANLRGFRSLFEGCGESGEGFGFDDWLIEAGHPELAQDVISAWERAQGAADEYSASLDQDSTELETLYQTVRSLTTLLKSDLFGAGSPLNLKLPGGVEGDTD